MDRLDKAIELYKQISNSCNDAKEKCKTCKRSKECNFYCDFASPMDVSFYLNQIGDLFSKEPSIQLKNIDVSNVNFWEQRDKLIKDGEKFTDRVFDYIFYYDNYDSEKNYKYKKHAIEEFWNMVQYGLGLLQKIDVDADEVMAEYPKHLQKIESQGNKPKENKNR